MRFRGTLLVLALALSVPGTSFSFDLGRATLQLAQRWEELSDDQREEAVRNYRRYKELSPEKRDDLERRYQKWKDMPSGDKERYRRKLRDFRGRGLLD